MLVRGQVAEAQEIAQAFAAGEPVLVEAGDRERVGHVDLLDEGLHLVDDVLHLRQPLRVDRRIGVQVDRARHAADDEVRVRVLAAEDRVQAGNVALPFERVEIVRDGHQVRFGRQLVLGMTPVGAREDAELAGFDEIRDLLLHVAEVADRRTRVAAQRLRQRRGGRRVGAQRRDDVDPVERVQVIEVHHVVVDVLRADHQVADQLRIRRHVGTDRVLDGANRGHAVHERADAADALRERPGIARIAIPQDDLDTADHRAGRVGLADLVAVHLALRCGGDLRCV